MFDGNADPFLHIAIPGADFSSATGISVHDTFRMGICTATQDNAIIKDYPLALASTSLVEEGLGDAVMLPEPGTLAMVA